METTEVRKKKDKSTEPVLSQVKESFGFVPDLMNVLADAPVVLEAYWLLLGCFDKCTLSPLERHVVLLTVSRENQSQYCVNIVLQMAKQKWNFPEGILEAAAKGTELPDRRLNVLATFTRSAMRRLGKVSKEELTEFQKAGFTMAQAIEVMLGIAQKTLANYVGNLTETLIDPKLNSRTKK